MKYNQLPEGVISEYFNRLVGKVYKLLPLWEENNGTLAKYHESLMLELTGATHIIISLNEQGEFVSLLASLESLMLISDKETYKRKVFECINLVKKMK